MLLIYNVGTLLILIFVYSLFVYLFSSVHVTKYRKCKNLTKKDVFFDIWDVLLFSRYTKLNLI